MSGNIIGRQNTQSLSTTPGIWTLGEHGNLKQINSWPSIVTNGLQMFLDGGNASSYPGSGSTWTDISGNGNNVTLNNTSGTTDAGGGIVCDSVNTASFAAGLTVTDGFTVSIWIKHTGTVDTTRIQRYFALNGVVLFRHGTTSAAEIEGLAFNSSGVTTTLEVAGQVVTNTYYNLVYTYDKSTFKVYNNNTEVGSLNSVITLATPTVGALKGGTGEYFEGNMYVVQYYNRGLSASEVAQNYNFFRSRFGL